MQIDAFDLEQWLARFEGDAEVVLGRDGVRPLEADRFDTSPATLGLPDPDETAALRERIADRYDRSGDEVVFTAGEREATLLAMLALLDAGRHTVVLTPTTQPLESLATLLGDVDAVGLGSPDWRVDADAVADHVRPETDLIVAANPNDPTGRVHDSVTIETLYDLAADIDAYLLVDERGRELLDSSPPAAASLGPRGVSTTDLSVSWGLESLQFGWLAGPPEVVSAVRHWRDYTTGGPSPLGQHVAGQALDQEADILEANRRHVDENRDLVASFLEDAGLTWHTPAGAVGFPTVPNGFASGGSFCRQVLRETGVLLVPGDVVGDRDRFRIGFGVETGTLSEGLDRLRTFLQRHA